MSRERLPRVAVLISGSGSNLQALLDATAAGELAAEIVLVASNRRAAYGLVRAEAAGVPTLYFPLKPYQADGRGRQTYDADLADRVAAHRPALVVLAGWMHILSPAFLDRFPGRVINLHPALPGQFDGVNAIERSFTAYRRGEITHGGCMVHVAVPAVDAGPVIVQEPVPIYPDDTLDSFAGRLHATEHRLIVAATRMMLARIDRAEG